jgi:hypothetical protein
MKNLSFAFSLLFAVAACDATDMTDAVVNGNPDGAAVEAMELETDVDMGDAVFASAETGPDTALPNWSDGLNWETNYTAALEQLKTGKKPMVVLFEDRTSPKTMLNESGIDAEAIAKTLEQFDLVHVDVTTDYGKKLVASFGAHDFPYTTVIGKGNNGIARLIGQTNNGPMTVTNWVNWVNKNRDPKNQTVSTSTSSSSGSGSYCPSCNKNRF